MNITFYDIESLDNVFSCSCFNERANIIQVFYLVDHPEPGSTEQPLLQDPFWMDKCRDRIYRKNRNFTGAIHFFDLHDIPSCILFAASFGMSDAPIVNNDRDNRLSRYPKRYRPVCDTDPEYQEDLHPYLMGYNSYNYDTTMMSFFLTDTFRYPNPRDPQAQNIVEQIQPVTAKRMRKYNDELFEDRWRKQMPSRLAWDPMANTMNYDQTAWRIRRNMLYTGRHLDVARLNEKQSKVALKRLLGMLGFQILESEKLTADKTHIDNDDEFFDLIAYNCSDIVNLKGLFYHKRYISQFELKKGLLKEYPELIYAEKDHTYRPDMSCVRRDRLTIDASSAQFATKSLCPYGHLKDIETVSFLYPAKQKAEELGIPQINVLEEAKNFFHKLYPNRPDLYTEFDRIYRFYKSIEGKNFNDSKWYREDYPNGPAPQALANIPKENTFLPYYDCDGNPTSCFVLFSTGGIHGAEYNQKLWNHDQNEYIKKLKDFTEAKRQYPDPVDLRKAKTITLPDGREVKYNFFLKSGKKISESEYKDPKENPPQLYVIPPKKMVKLNDKYVFTSAGEANHEDFKSYYPNLLRMMMAFYNKGLGYDRYAQIFEKKEDYGAQEKDPNLPKEEQEHVHILREGTKLILNSASGAADAKFENSIRVNNQIISMRIIGQLFSWRIGQAQAYEGAKMISTNTDGLYSILEETKNNQILAREAKNIGVAIEPEPLFLISKDTNNRLELNQKGKIIGASGGTLGCRKGPDPVKSLAHPAIIDWALAEYLIVAAEHYRGLALEKPFDREIGRAILEKATQCFDPVQYLIMMQNIIASSPGSTSYIFALPDLPETTEIPEKKEAATALQHYNRVFILKDQSPDTVHLHMATAKVITEAMAQKRKRNEEKEVQNDPLAKYILEKNGVLTIPPQKEAVVKRIPNLDPAWYMRIENHDLHMLSEDKREELVSLLDDEKYLDLLEDCYESNWRNHLPETAA